MTSRPSIRAAFLLALALMPGACGPRRPPSSTEVGTIPDSTWFMVTGPTIIAFHPRVTNEQLDADEGLATVLDDLAYHLGSAMDSLDAAGVAVRYHAGDTIKLLTPGPSIWVRHLDSADVGYLFVDTRGHRAGLFGVRTNIDLLQFAREFARTGRLMPS